MSSLAASRADGYYFPPDYDPARHGSLNQFRGQHPLRERASKLDQGILVIRFEMPFNVWCGGCNHLIGKGVRFNAEKKQIGSYYSTKIWSFTMRAPCCSQKIEVQTDPKNTEYVVVSGGTRKAETWTAESAETMELPDRDEEAAVAPLDDPFSKLERGETDKRKGRELGVRVAELFHDSNEKFRDDYSINKALRRNNRALRKQEKEREVRRKSLGLSDDIKLLPEAPEDSFAASLVQFGDPAAFTKKWQQKRRAIKAQSIFASSAAVKPAAAPQSRVDGHKANPAAEGRSAPASGAREHSRRGTKRSRLSSSGIQHQAKRRHMGLDPIVEEAEEQADGTSPAAEARPDQSRQADRPAKRHESAEGRAQLGVPSSSVPAGAKLRTAVSRLLGGSLSGAQQKRKKSIAEKAAAAAKRQRGH